MAIGYRCGFNTRPKRLLHAQAIVDSLMHDAEPENAFWCNTVIVRRRNKASNTFTCGTALADGTTFCGAAALLPEGEETSFALVFVVANLEDTTQTPTPEVMFIQDTSQLPEIKTRSSGPRVCPARKLMARSLAETTFIDQMYAVRDGSDAISKLMYGHIDHVLKYKKGDTRCLVSWHGSFDDSWVDVEQPAVAEKLQSFVSKSATGGTKSKPKSTKHKPKPRQTNAKQAAKPKVETSSSLTRSSRRIELRVKDENEDEDVEEPRAAKNAKVEAPKVVKWRAQEQKIVMALHHAGWKPAAIARAITDVGKNGGARSTASIKCFVQRDLANKPMAMGKEQSPKEQKLSPEQRSPTELSSEEQAGAPPMPVPKPVPRPRVESPPLEQPPMAQQQFQAFQAYLSRTTSTRPDHDMVRHRPSTTKYRHRFVHFSPNGLAPTSIVFAPRTLAGREFVHPRMSSSCSGNSIHCAQTSPSHYTV